MGAHALLADRDERIERRYVALARLARSVAAAGDVRQLAIAVGTSLEDPLGTPAAARLWAITSDGVEELARHPGDGAYPPVPQRELQRAARTSEPSETPGGRMLVGLHSAGLGLGVLEVEPGAADPELLGHAAAIVACSFGPLAGQGAVDVLPAPVSLQSAGDAASLMATFAAEAKRLLDHDRLSAYLLTGDGRAFERFAVATSPIIPGEGVVIPFEDVGLRHVVMTNRPLVSADLGGDPRIVGREDRVIAGAGFHGLISIPLRLAGRPFGVLNFVSRQEGFYSDEDLPIAEQIADQVAAFVSNLRAQERLRTLIRHEAVERERARVARDVHHAVGHTLAEIDAMARGLERRLAGDAAARAQATRVRELVRLELADVRRAVADLAPRALDAHTLAEAIESALTGLGDDDPRPRLTIAGDTGRLSRAARRAAFRIFQEALANTRTHARARGVEVTLRVDRDLTLSICDDGVGFAADAAARSGGTGLQAMHDRARALGGILTVQAAPSRGAAVTFRMLGAGEGADCAPPPEESLDQADADERRLRAFVTEPHSLVRAGIVAVLEQSGDVRVVGQAATGEETRGQVKRLHPDVILLESQLGEGEAERTIVEVKAALPACAVLLLADYETGREAELLDAGAGGVVAKSIAGPELASTVRAIVRGAKVAGLHSPVGRPGGSGLSARERAVLALLSAGLTNAEIGARLFLATKTVERQVATIVRKLGARNRAHAGAIAVARHLVEPSELGD